MSIYRDLLRKGERVLFSSFDHTLENYVGGKPPPVFIDLTGLPCAKEDMLPAGQEEYIPPYPDIWFEWNDQVGPASIGVRFRSAPFDPLSALPYLMEGGVFFRSRGSRRVNFLGLVAPIIGPSGRLLQYNDPLYATFGALQAARNVGGYKKLFLDWSVDQQLLAADGDSFIPVAPAYIPGMEQENVKSLLVAASEVIEHACTLLHCKNVALSERALRGARIRRKKAKGLVWHRLVVCVPGVRKKYGLVVPNQHSEPLVRHHVQRGHFKVYTEDAPLFGQHVGRFWWSPHARGSSDVGEVVKDYSVKTDSP